MAKATMKAKRPKFLLELTAAEASFVRMVMLDVVDWDKSEAPYGGYAEDIYEALRCAGAAPDSLTYSGDAMPLLAVEDA